MLRMLPRSSQKRFECSALPSRHHPLTIRQMNRLFVYEEYGAKYEMMMKDIASAHRTMPQWELYQKGLETLASSLDPTSKHSVKSKKSLTIGDLLVKVSLSAPDHQARSLTCLSQCNESANTLSCSQSCLNTLPSWTLPTLTWRLRMLSSGSEKQHLRSIEPLTTRV